MKKRLSKFIFIIVAIFTFYSVYRVEERLNSNNPIIKEIRETASKYNKNYINAKIIGNNIISGKNGKEINYKKTYRKMKQYGSYNETLTTLKEVTPEISIKKNYDKYLIGGNQNDRKISLVFAVKENKSFLNIIKILNTKKAPGTFFIDGTYLEKSRNIIKNNKIHEFELLSYQNKYEEDLFKTSLSYLSSITNIKTKYCYTEKEQENLLNICQKLKLHTIKPTYIIKKDLYKQIKEILDNGLIISIDNNYYIEKELSITIDYLKEKGYQMVTLNELLSEENKES